MITRRSNAARLSAAGFAADNGAAAADQPVVLVEQDWRCPPPSAATGSP
jgi:AraC family transcriptional regulator